MSTFEYITVALSFVLGLGITRILLASVYVFRSRKTLKVHWIPIVWAMSVFLIQIQYWWAIFELSNTVDPWTALHFGTLLILALTLFIAGALVLPTTADANSNSLLENFDYNGRWALLFLLGYSTMGLWANWYLFGVSPVSFVGGMAVIAAILPMTYLLARSRRIQSVATAMYLALTVWFIGVTSPASY